MKCEFCLVAKKEADLNKAEHPYEDIRPFTICNDCLWQILDKTMNEILIEESSERSTSIGIAIQIIDDENLLAEKQELDAELLLVKIDNVKLGNELTELIDNLDWSE